MKPLTTFDDSILYIERLILIGISKIVYLRALLPEPVFLDNFFFENIRIRLLNTSCDFNKDAQTLSEWITGAFEALEKNYVILQSSYL